MAGKRKFRQGTSSGIDVSGGTGPKGVVGSDGEISKRSRLPLHLEISEMLAREIKAGVLLDGEKLEPERAMAVRLGIAVGTLRKALAELHDAGLLERVQGSGNYVRNIDTTNTIYGFFRLELLAGGGLPSASTLSVKHVKSEMLDFGQQGHYYQIRRQRFLNGVSAAIEEIWLNADYVEQPLTQLDLSDSLYQYYKEHLGFWIARVEDSLGVEIPPRWIPDAFELQAGSQWGYVERRSWDQLNRQVEFSKTWYDPATTRYVARWK